MDGTGSIGGTDNVFLGSSAGGGSWATATSNSNIGIGTNVMDAAMNGATYNIGIGYVALTDLTEGDYNVAVGGNAGGNITTGSSNTVIGHQAGDTLQTGENNIFIGKDADSAHEGYDNCIVIAHTLTNNNHNQVWLGRGSQTFFKLMGAKAIASVEDHNIAAGGSKTITLAIGAHQSWISGVMHIVATGSGTMDGGIYHIAFSASMKQGSTTTDVTQTVVHSDRGNGSSNYIELNAPSAGTSNITWVLDNDHSGAFNSLNIACELYGRSAALSYMTLSTS